ncbi:alpha/beta-hydrolase [Westerdykella ornata]|uniref:Carboxylic ester hydrolase n=1 Tax=Westerdykella ornata TaxID=318751 RepID=A0A6A6JCF0_WESOR|nr:alpha/beta-hydrolase [Westerdykella ornata]KAF2273306.1 alpha/beta-hydrolase [Westerdykella ornata]
MVNILLAFLALCVRRLIAVDPVVDLGYAQYRGVYQGNGSVIRWAGMRYARSVSRVDGLRFTAPQDPLPERPGIVVDASEFGSICIGSKSVLKNEFGGRESEDCLFANVFAPADATNTSALPVYVFIQGGGFNDNGNADYNGAQLIDAANGQMVVVNFNYRVGPYGFLASKEIAEDKELSLNNGLKDQRQLLKWVKTHISKFGGDPNHIVLGGASAGGGSVVMHLTAYGGRNDDLFHAAFAESPAFPPIRNAEQSQFAYDALLQETQCADLKCLRDMDAVSFQAAVRRMKVAFPRGSAPPVYFWNPTLDYNFIKDYTYNEIKAGHLVRVPTIFGDTTNEGTVFTPKTITSLRRAEQFITSQFTNINQKEIVRFRRVWRGPVDPVFDSRWRKIASDIYGHIRYTCGALNISAAYAADGTVPIRAYRWNVGTAVHVSELPAIWSKGSTAAGRFMQGYLASFVRSYDPNKYPVEFRVSGNKTLVSPKWATFGNGQRMVFNSGDEVEMAELSRGERAQCEVITGMGIQLEQ